MKRSRDQAVAAGSSETVSVVNPKARKAIAKDAIKHLHASKAFKAKEKLKESGFRN
jgi:hypothetical protein